MSTNGTTSGTTAGTGDGPGRRATEVVAAEWDRLLRLLDDADALLDRPTALAGWTVEDLARHVHWGMTLEADGLRLLVAPGDPLPEARAHGTTFTGPRAGLLPALRVARRALVDRLTATQDAPEDALVPMPYGPLPLALARQVFVMEAAMHSYDAAAALDGDGTGVRLGGADHEHRDSTVLPACAAVLQAFWPALASAGSAPAPGTGIALEGSTVRIGARFGHGGWGPLVGAPDVVLRGPDEPLLLLAYGRLALGAVPVEVVGDRELAERFKELVPGP